MRISGKYIKGESRHLGTGITVQWTFRQQGTLVHRWSLRNN